MIKTISISKRSGKQKSATEKIKKIRAVLNSSDSDARMIDKIIRIVEGYDDK